MFPLQNRKLIRGFQAHIKAGLGGAADYVADRNDLFLPFAGKVETYYGTEGGNWLRLTRDNGDKLEFAHLDSYLIKPGYHSEGTKAAITGNTGIITTGPHLHTQIIRNGVRLDPEAYEWKSMTNLHLTVVANNINFPALDGQVATVANWVKMYSRDRINLTFDVKTSAFNSVPFDEEFLGIKAPQINWYRENITPLATGHLTLFLMNPAQWQGSVTGVMNWGDPGKPGRISLMLDELSFVSQAFHEICHALLFFAGMRDNYTENGQQRFVVHDYLFQDPPKYYELLDRVDYSKLQSTLNTIKPTTMNQAKVVKSKNSSTVYICYPIPDMDYLQKKANLEGFQIPANIPNTDSL